MTGEFRGKLFVIGSVTVKATDDSPAFWDVFARNLQGDMIWLRTCDKESQALDFAQLLNTPF